MLPVKRFDDAKQRLDKTLDAGTRKALAEAMVSDVLHALRRSERIDKVIVVTGENGARGAGPRLRRRVDRPTTTAATRTPRAPASTGRSSATTSASCSSPATARRSTRARSTSWWPAR